MLYLPALSSDQSDNIKAGQKDSSTLLLSLPFSLPLTSFKLEVEVDNSSIEVEEVEEMVSSDFLFVMGLDLGARHFFNKAGFGRVSVVFPREV